MLSEEDKAEVAMIATTIVRDVLLLAAEAASHAIVFSSGATKRQASNKSEIDIAAERAAMSKFLES